MTMSGQLWYATEGGDSDTRIARINDDGTSATLVDSNGTTGIGDDQFASSFTSDIGVDTSAGFYFAILSNSIDDHATLVRGSTTGSGTPTVVVDFADNIIVNTIEVDAVNRKIYAGYQDGSATPNGNITGIRVYSYDAAGTLTDLGFLTTAVADNRANESGYYVLDPRDFALDSSTGRLFYTELLSAGVGVVGIYRLDLSDPNNATQLVSQAQFPDSGSNGFIHDVEVDESTHLVYFSTQSRHPSGTAEYVAGQNAIWFIDESASGGTATKVTLTGLPGGSVLYPGDMTFDQSTRQLYVESEETNGSDADDVIYVFQLNAAGDAASLIRSINPGFTHSGANIEGLTFVDLPDLDVTGSGLDAHAQGAAVTLLNGAPTITDTDSGYLTSATVQITGGTFASGETSAADDHLGYGASKQISGTISGTSITVSWNASTETLTLSGYDTIAHYQTALAGLTYWATGSNPTNDGANATRTITWTVSDGMADVPAGAVNSGTTTVDILVNQAPTVSGDGTETLAASNEDVSPTTLANTVSTLFGAQYGDADSDTFAGVAVVGNGSSAGTGQWQYWNGSSWVNIGSASTSAAVELSASTPIRFAPAADYNGAAPTLTVRLVDASGGAITSGTIVNTTTNGNSTVFSSGTVVLDHTISAVNDAPVTVSGSAVTLTTIAEDSAPGAGQTVSSLFASHFSDAKDQVPGGSTANGFAGIAVTANAASAAQGVYQYFDGSNWQDLPPVSSSSAFVIEASTLVRFVPAPNYSGTAPSLTAHMIDDSSGAVATGQQPNLTTTGGTTQYGTALTLGITVTGTNDAPLGTGSATLAAVDEDTASPAGATVSSLFGSHFSDVDGDSLAGVAISVNHATGAEGVWQYFDGASWVTIGTPSESNALVLSTGASLRFLPAANYSGTPPTLEVYLIDNSGGAVTTGSLVDVTTNGDQTPFSDTTVTLATSVSAVNDTPSAPASATTVNAVEQTPATLLGSLAVSDIELDARNGGSGDYSGASFTVQRAVANASDDFAFNTSGASFSVNGSNLQAGGLTFATFTSAGGVLTVSFTSAAAAATTALVNDVIDHIQYTNSSDAPPPSVTLSYSFDDGSPGSGQGSGGTGTASGTVQVNLTAVNDPHTGGASITGTAAEDQVLTAVSTLVDPDGIGTLHYQWQRDTGSGYVNIGADQSTYTLGDGDIGGAVRVVVSYTDAGGTAEAATSAATADVAASNDPHTGGVSITGTATEDQLLTAVSTLADVDGLGTLHYDWQRDTGSGFVSIGAADQATYALGDADVGGQIRTVVSYTDGQGFTESATSAPTAAIANINDAPTGGVSVTGTTTQNQTLTASTSTLGDADGLGALHYQWQRDLGSGYVNVGTDQSTYTLTDADVGGLIRVITSYVDGHGTAQAVTSAATAAIEPANYPATGAPAISDTTPTEGQALIASVGTIADGNGVPAGISWQWQVDNGAGFVDIGLATSASFTPTTPQLGKPLRVVASFTDLDGFSETRVSAATSVVGDSFVGTNGPNTFNGSPGADVADGLGGNDTLNGLGGNDTLTGGAGNDTVRGGDGNDSLFGGDGNDKLYGGNGEDTVSGGNGNDTLYGDDGSDLLNGDAGNDALYGGSGNDTLNGGAGNDVLRGEAGNDTLPGGDGNDQLWGGDGDDQISGGSGNDKLYGDAGNDILTGDAGNDILRGGVGNDTLSGGTGNDSLQGDAGNDSLSGGEGNDQLYGSDGNDTLNGDNGHDKLFGDAGDDILSGGAGNDALTGGDGNDQLAGGDGNDVLNGGNGNDVLSGDAGFDRLLGGVGNDSISGGTDNDYLDGGTGNDVLNGDAGHDSVKGGTGDDQLHGGAGNDVMLGGTGNDWLWGEDDNDILSGGAGNDTIMGGNGNDRILGDTGNDRLEGDAGADSISGGDGNDVILGGAGNDFLFGGSGNDSFVFDPNFGSDRIEGFDANPNGGQDYLDLSALGINPGNFATEVHWAQDGADTVITLDEGTIRLVHVNVASISQSDFLF